MKKGSEAKRNVTTKQAIEMMRKKGVELDEKEAEKTLEIMYFLAKFIVNQNFRK